ncbi:hypothetical protein Tco_0398062 [Tanacetum coccineum]
MQFSKVAGYAIQGTDVHNYRNKNEHYLTHFDSKDDKEFIVVRQCIKRKSELAFMAWNVIACLYGMNVIACLHDMVDKLAFMAWLLACLRGMDGKVCEIGSKNEEGTGFDDDDVLDVLAWIQGCLGLEAWTNGRFEASLAKLAKDVVKLNLTHLRHVMLCMMSNVKKLAFMAWNVIACLHGMNVIACLHDMVDKLAFMAWLLACLRGMDGKVLMMMMFLVFKLRFKMSLGLEAWTNGRFKASLAKLAKDVSYGLMIDENDAYVMNDVIMNGKRGNEVEAGIGDAVQGKTSQMGSLECLVFDGLLHRHTILHNPPIAADTANNCRRQRPLIQWVLKRKTTPFDIEAVDFDADGIVVPMTRVAVTACRLLLMPLLIHCC